MPFYLKIAQLLICSFAVAGFAHWMIGRVSNKLFVFLPLVFLVPFGVPLDFVSSLGGLGLVLVVGGGITAYSANEAKENARNRRTKARMSKVAKYGFGATMIGAVLTYFQQEQSDITSNEAQQSIKSLSEQIVKLSSSNLALAKENTNIITGGDSLFYLDIEPNTKGGKPYANLAVIGQYPIPDVRLFITDFTATARARAAGDGEDSLAHHGYLVQLGSVAANSNMRLARFNLPAKGEGLIYTVKIFQREHVATQIIAIRQMTIGTYAFASRLYRVDGMENGNIRLKLLKEFSKTDPALIKDEFGKTPFVDYPGSVGNYKLVE